MVPVEQACKLLLGWMAAFWLLGKMIQGPNPRQVSSVAKMASEGRKDFVTGIRSGLMIQVVLGILAVDFAAFPRRHAKTETFGLSLMDVGVGCMLFSAGLVSAGRFDGANVAGASFRSAARSSLPMLVLGILRTAAVKFLGYQEHVSEYGVHWNFFITMALLPILCAAVARIVPLKRFGIAGLLLSVGYEVLLKKTGLEAFLLSDRRGPDLLSLNKEGAFSVVGCLALFLLGCWVGAQVRQVRDVGGLRRFALRLLAIDGAAWLAFLALRHTHGWEASRRLMNLQFNLWILAFCSLHLFIFLASDWVWPKASAHNRLAEGINRNQLMTFLLANLATGLVNSLWRTMLLGRASALLIMTGYALLVFGLTAILHEHGVTLKV